MAVTDDATLKAHSHTYIRDVTIPSGVTRVNVSALMDQVIDSKVSRGDRPFTPQGAWDASTNIVPSNGDATILKGYIYDNGNFESTTLLGPDGNVILAYATIRALIDAPGPLLSDRSKWRITY